MTRSRHILPPRIPYTPEEDAIVRDLWPINATHKVAKLIDRSTSSVDCRARRLGFAGKDPTYLATKAHRRNGHEPNSIKHRFKKGDVPANKGLRRPGYGPGRMRETQFKKGEMRGAAQHNYKPIGSERISHDGYLERKVTDDHPVPARRWVGVHRLVWEAANGPIPDGHVVAFLPGRHSTDAALITLDALELVSHRERMRRNSIHNYPPAIKRAMQARGALVRTLRRIEKQENPE